MSPFLDLNDTDAHEKKITIKDLVLFKSLLPYIKPHWRLIAISAVLLPLISLTQVVQPVILKRAIDGPIVHGQINALWQYVFFFLGLLVVHYALRYAQMYLAQVVGQRIILSLRAALYDHLQSLSVAFYHRTPLGVLVTRVSSDVENISEVFATGGIAIFSDFAVIIGILVAMVIMDARLAAVALTIVPVVIITMEFFRRRSRAAYNDMRVQLAQVNSTLQESLGGIEVIQLSRRETRNVERFRDLCRTFMQTNLRSVVYDSAFTASVEFLSYTTILLVFAAVVLGLGGGTAKGVISFGLLVAFLQYIQMLFEPIEEISDKFTIIQSGLASVEKIMELMNQPTDIVVPAQPVTIPRARGEIQFENVTFGYDPANPVLRGISFTLKPGEKAAFIGSTGAGKSTLIRLLNRQYDPQGGRILLDGVDIRMLDPQALRRNIVVIPQDDFLFSRTVRENVTLAYTHGKADNEMMQRLDAVAEKVHADQVLERLNNGWETELPERGRSLSNGERQLLVFARALWRDPPVLVLDEATSAIDPQTEALLQDALDKSLEGRTAIVIAHRLSTIESVDTIYVLAGGIVAESGSPLTLEASQGLYWAFKQAHAQEVNQT